MPHLLDLLDIEREGVGQRLLGQPRRNADAKRPGGKLQQRKAARHVEMVEHLRDLARRVRPAGEAQPLDRVGNADRAVVHVGRLAFRNGPQQRHRLGHVADIVAAHAEQHRVDPLLG